MSKLKALIMAILLLAGGLYVWKSEKEEKQKFAEETAKRKVFQQINETAVKLISATSQQGTFRVYRQGYKDNKQTVSPIWLLNSPEGALADIAKVKNIIFSLLSLESGNVIQKEEILEDQSQYGLIPPELVLTFEGDFGRKVFSFGKKVAATSRRYMQPQDEDRIFLVDESIFKSLSVSAEDIADKKPLKLDSQDLKQVIALRDGPFPKGDELNNLRKENDYLKFDLDEITNIWTLSQGDKKIVTDQQQIKNKFSAFSALTAKHVIDASEERLAIYGLNKPLLTVSLINKKEDQLTFQVGEGVSIDALKLNPDQILNKDNLAIERAYYLRILGSNVVYEMKHSYFSDFQQNINFFRSKTPFSGITLNNLESFILSKKNSLVNLAGKDGAEELLKAINNLKIITYSDISEEEKNNISKSQFTNIELKEQNTRQKLILGDKVKAASNSSDANNPYWVYLLTEDNQFLAAVVAANDYNSILKAVEEVN